MTFKMWGWILFFIGVWFWPWFFSDGMAQFLKYKPSWFIVSFVITSSVGVVLHLALVIGAWWYDE